MSSPYASPAPGPQPEFTPVRSPRPSRAPKILMIIGGVILALSVIIGVTITVIGIVTTAGGDFEEFPGGSGSFSAEQGEVIQFYMEEGTTPPTCTLYTPDGAEPEPGTTQTSTRTVNGTSWESFDSFTAPVSGEYEIDCTGTAVAVGPPVSIGGIFGAIGGVLVGLGGGFLGVVLLGIGIVMWLMNRKKAQ